MVVYALKHAAVSGNGSTCPAAPVTEVPSPNAVTTFRGGGDWINAGGRQHFAVSTQRAQIQRELVPRAVRIWSLTATEEPAIRPRQWLLARLCRRLRLWLCRLRRLWLCRLRVDAHRRDDNKAHKKRLKDVAHGSSYGTMI
jgi:hypothetical protein